MSRTLKTEALVLRKRTLLDKDLLVSLFSQSDGKITVIAKGVKKVTSRRAPHLETANLIKAQLRKKGERTYIESTSLVSGFSELKETSGKVDRLYSFLFVLDRLLPEGEREDRVYRLAKKFMIDLSSAKDDGQSVIKDYLNKLMSFLGYLHQDRDPVELKSLIEEIIDEKIPTF